MKSLPRLKKCRVCLSRFQPFTTTQVVCTDHCAVKLMNQKREKAFRAETAKRREAIKTKSEWEKEVQSEFNRYIRARDFDKPCISCGLFIAEPIGGCLWDCGHFLSIGGYPELRFNEDNAHRQHSRCNRGAAKSQRNDKTVSAQYRENLVERIGLQRVEALEGPHEALHLSTDELKALKAKYQKLAREALKYARIQTEAMQA